MIVPCTCENEAAIRHLLIEHGDELVAEKQEVMIAWLETQVVPARAVITGYELPSDGEYADTLGVDLGNGFVYLISPAQITHFEVLNTRRMTPELGYQQMKEMERAGGVISTP